MPVYTFRHNLLNVLVQTANKMRFRKKNKDLVERTPSPTHQIHAMNSRKASLPSLQQTKALTKVEGDALR
jgi:hypothetical protein